MAYSINRKPTTPGELLREEYLLPIGMTQKQLADHIGCDVKVINRIIKGRCATTAAIAIKLAAAFKTSPDFWLNAQKAIDIHNARKRIGPMPKPIIYQVKAA